MQHFILFSIGLAVVIDILLLLSLYQKSNDAPVRSFQQMILGALFWNACTFLFILTEHGVLAPLAYISALYFSIMRHHFVVKYTHTETPCELRILTGIAILLSLLACVPNALFVYPHVSPEGYIFVENGWFTIYFVLYLVYMTIRPLQILIRHTFVTKSHAVRVLAIGMSIYATITIVTNFILPVFFNIPVLNTIGPAFSSFFSLLVFYAIGRYQFLHIKLILQRGIIFAILYAFILALYSGVITSIMIFDTLHSTLLHKYTIAFVILLAAFFVAPLERFLRKLTDRFLLQQNYSYDETTRELADLFAQHVTTNTILRHTLSYMKEKLRLKHLNYHKGATVPEKFRRAHIAFPIHASKECVGYLLVGRKRSGDPLTKTDSKILAFYITILGVALEKAHLFEHLEEEVEARTKEVALFRDEERNRLAILAHDLKTPLTVLLGTHEIISKSPEISREQFDMLGKPLRTMRQTINEIVHFESPTTVTHEKLALSDLLEGISEQMEVLCTMENITFTHSLTPHIYITGHSRDLELMCNNILANAIRYKSSFAPEISLTLTLTNGTALVTIKDNGIGIPAKELYKVMQSGYRASNTRGREGTGTGLATVKKIASAHGATIHIDSTEHVGTVVTFRFQTLAVRSV